jgi:glycosyltransferase involved in cell wall biosynthesis
MRRLTTIEFDGIITRLTIRRVNSKNSHLQRERSGMNLPMLNPSPKVTVIMPVFNGAHYLSESLGSILAQTWEDFELLVLDDGSTDNSVEIVSRFRDDRIRLERNERNIGLTATLNRGLDLARGQYVARMDCDDVSRPNRLERQVGFLDDNRQVGIVSSWAEVVDEAGSIPIRRVIGQLTGLGNSPHSLSTTDPAIRFNLLFTNIVVHSSVMFRRDLLNQHNLRYSEAFKFAEDYEFWVRCSRAFQLALIPEILVNYRSRPDSVSNLNLQIQRETANRVRLDYLRSLGLDMGPKEESLHIDITNFQFAGDLARLLEARDWLSTLLEYARSEFGLPKTFQAGTTAGLYWYHACGALANYGVTSWQIYRSSPFSDGARLRWFCSLMAHCLAHKSVPRHPGYKVPG